MNVLMIGAGHGSFEVRGKQLGAALGARVTPMVLQSDLAWADVVVLIKHAAQYAERVHAAGKPLVWDALDFWQQPVDNIFNEQESFTLLKDYLCHVKPTLTIGATQAMAKACGGVYLPHHARPGLTPRPVRDKVEVVAYEGTKKYLGQWAKAIDQECARRGWKFVINPPDLSDADIIVAFRDGQWDGWMCREWKSGVKAVNAIAVGRPFISQECAAVTEIRPAGSQINAKELSNAFDFWANNEMRAEAGLQAACHEFALPWVARSYRSILERAC